MTRIEDQLEMLAAAPPLRPRLPMRLACSAFLSDQTATTPPPSRTQCCRSCCGRRPRSNLGARWRTIHDPNCSSNCAVSQSFGGCHERKRCLRSWSFSRLRGTVVSGSQSVYIADQVIQQRGVSYPITNQNILVGPFDGERVGVPPRERPLDRSRRQSCLLERDDP